MKNLHETYQCRMYSGELLMMGREDARNMWSFITEYIWIIRASGWLFKKKPQLQFYTTSDVRALQVIVWKTYL